MPGNIRSRVVLIKIITIFLAALPKIVLDGNGAHDPVPGVAPEGIQIKARIELDPEEGLVTVDLRSNSDNVAGGLNLTEATVTAASLIGVLHNISPTVPHNEGAFSRINIKLREGAVVGIPKYPVGTGLATTNVADRLTTVIESAFAKLGPPYGIAEGCTGFGASPVISGKDWRYNNAPYVNQLIILGGGPGVHGHDGWITYGVAQDNGVLHQDSVEVDEQKYPILFEKVQLATNSGGDGKWRGAPAIDIEMTARKDPVTIVFCNDQHYFPAKGVLGGGSARPSDIMKYDADIDELTHLPQMSEITIQPGEKFIALNATGGGYGDPLDRDPEMVRWDVQEEVLSIERARDIYGVVLDAGSENFEVNYEATDKLRSEIKSKRGNA